MRRALLVLSFLLFVGTVSAKMSVYRSIDDVMWAIGKSRKMDMLTRKAWAEAIIDEAIKHGFDPYTMVAIMDNESKLNPSAIGGYNGHCVGLGQTCLSNYKTCRDSDYQSAECNAHRLRLLNWRESMRQVGTDIERWRKWCRRHTGHSALFHRWLAAYQGYNGGQVWCGMRKVKGRWKDVPMRSNTKAVINYRRKLIRERRR